MSMLDSAVLCSSLILALVLNFNYPCAAADLVTIVVTEARCPTGTTGTCCTQKGSKEVYKGKAIVDEGDSIQWNFAQLNKAKVQFQDGTNCPFSTAKACRLKGSAGTVSSTQPVKHADPGTPWPYSPIKWNNGHNSCQHVIEPNDPGEVYPPGIVMRPPQLMDQ